MESCVDGQGACGAMVGSWQDAKISAEQVSNYYVAKLGSEAKDAAANKRCGTK